ncbi:MAG: ADP-ribosylglycohydrolase family protein [Tannerella sp.]|jgi:ADP-ribosyl-[dinitrogen reductase] hydrolase|nr:ADP-ribosylglycohydrolase family protein [Tannerella sp.]
MEKDADLIDKCHGMFVGLAVGDALGSELQAKWSLKLPNVLRPKPGDIYCWSDDTSMALCMADSLLACNGYDSYDVMKRYYNWLYKGYRRNERQKFDFGMQVATAIDAYAVKSFISESDPHVKYMGNGGIMRLAPAIIAACSSRSITEIIRLSRISSRETHYNYHADACAEVMAAIICTLLQSKDKTGALNVNQYSTGRLFGEILQSVTKATKYEDSRLNSFGNAIETLENAMWGLMNRDSFESGMEAILELDGDMDTNAAVYGQLAGAFYGYNAIPLSWRTATCQESDIRELADKLLNMTECPVIRTRFEEDGMTDPS